MAVELVRARNWPEERSGLSWGALGGGTGPKTAKAGKLCSTANKASKGCTPRRFGQNEGGECIPWRPRRIQAKKKWKCQKCKDLPLPSQSRANKIWPARRAKDAPPLFLVKTGGGYASLGVPGASKPKKM